MQIKCLALCLLVLGSGLVRQAAAAPGRDVEWTFYAEPALRTEVGSRFLSCGGGGIHTQGRVTRFYVRVSTTCPTGPHAVPVSVSCHFTEAGCTLLGGFSSAARHTTRHHRHRHGRRHRSS